MEILVKDDHDMARAHKEYGIFSQDDTLRDLYEAREKWKKDYNTAIYYTKKEGIEKGKKEGEILDKQDVLTHIMRKKFGISNDEADFIKATVDPEILDRTIDIGILADRKSDVFRILQ
jgi:hypothetical protein